jgi:uncharacterized protein YdgA (DUF945 family)
MNRKVKLIGAVVFLSLGAGAAALYWSGVHAQRIYEQSLAGVNSQGVFNARTASYRRGLLSSEAVTEVTFNTGSPQYQSLIRSEPDTLLKNFRLVLASDIEHLPAPSSFAAGGADLTITTRLDDRDSRQLAWISKAGLHDVLRMTTRVGVDGNSTVTLDVKPVTYQAPETGDSLDWGGLQGKFDIGVGEQYHQISGTVHSSGFTAHTGLQQVMMDGLRYDLDGHFDIHDFFIGSQSVVIDGLRASPPADAAGPGAMSLGKLALQGEAHADDASLSVSSNILLTDLNAAGERIPRFTLRVAADKLDMAMLAELRDLLASANTDGGRAAPIDPALQSQIQEKLLAMLEGGPQVRITELLLETGTGDLRGNLALQLVQPPPEDAVIPSLFWLSAIQGEAHVTIAEPLLTRLAISGTRATLVAGYEAQKKAPPSDKELNAAAINLARTRLSSLETLGVLLHEGNAFRTDITLAHRELLINGKPFQSLSPDISSN